MFVSLGVERRRDSYRRRGILLLRDVDRCQDIVRPITFGDPRCLGRRAGVHCRLQPAPADGERRLPYVLWQLRVRDAGIPVVGRSAADDCRRRGGRPVQGETVSGISVRRHPRGSPGNGRAPSQGEDGRYRLSHARPARAELRRDMTTDPPQSLPSLLHRTLSSQAVTRLAGSRDHGVHRSVKLCLAPESVHGRAASRIEASMRSISWTKRRRVSSLMRWVDRRR
jgi:hypothetical protein